MHDSNLIHTYLWWWWSSWIWHTSRGWGVAGGLLRGIASWPRWVASSRGIGHLQQKEDKILLYGLITTTVTRSTRDLEVHNNGNNGLVKQITKKRAGSKEGHKEHVDGE